MRYFPAFLDLQSASALIVGGGAIAVRKLDLLSQAGASVTVISPTAASGIAERAKDGSLRWLARRFDPADVNGMRIVRKSVV